MSDLHSAFPPGTVVPVPVQFTCPLCGGTYSVRGFSNHVTRCCSSAGLSMPEYERRHSTYLYSPVHQFAAKWFSLAKLSVTRFGLMDYGGCYWCQIDADAPQDWYRNRFGRRPETLPLVLCNEGHPELKRSFLQFRQHLAGRLTLGIWPHMSNRFTFIDLDEEHAKHRVELMTRLIDLRLHFYIENSGSQGYHFWVFWDRLLPNEALRSIHDRLCQDIAVDRNVWPFKPGLIKLPLGLHRGTNQLACFVDYQGDLIPLDEQLEYCLNMTQNPVPTDWLQQPVNAELEEQVVSTAEVQEPHSGTLHLSVTPSVCEALLAQGKKLPRGRHVTLFVLALYLKNQRKVAMGEAKEVLDQWSYAVRSKQSTRSRLRDVRTTLERVYAGTVSQYSGSEAGEGGVFLPMRVHGAVGSSTGPKIAPKVVSDGMTCPSSGTLPELTEKERTIVREVCVSSLRVLGAVGSKPRRGDTTKRLKTATRVALAMAALAKPGNGWLEIGYRDLMRLAGVSKQALRRALDLFVADNAREDPPEDEYDPVLWEFDQRPRRHGELFVCLNRGSFPTCDRSVYRLSEALLRQLGWCAEGGDRFGFPPSSCSAPAVHPQSVVIADDQFARGGFVTLQ